MQSVEPPNLKTVDRMKTDKTGIIHIARCETRKDDPRGETADNESGNGHEEGNVTESKEKRK